MAAVPQLLHVLVVVILVRDVEGAVDGAAVGVSAGLSEDLVVEIPVLEVHGVVEGERNHLGRLTEEDEADR